MNYKRISTAALLLALAAPTGGFAQMQTGGGGPVSDQYIERQKRMLEDNLQSRLADIEQRFSEEEAFRVKQKDGRLAFERKLFHDRGLFLDSLRKLRPADRSAALQAYYGRMKEKRKEFNDQRKAESRQFWEARMGPRNQQTAAR